jgi:sucrose-6-phosphate hydrolase SacC (GH32 family)
MEATETPALPLIRQRLERLGLELQQLEHPQTREQWARAFSIFREIEATEAQVQALAQLQQAEAHRIIRQAAGPWESR